MNDNFKKLKKKAWIIAILKCLLVGIAAGLFVTGVALLSCRLAKFDLYVLWYVLFAVGSVLLGAGISFSFFRVTDEKLARELDRSVGRERVQTALAYQASEGDIYELQRNDAAERLAPVKPAFTRLWLFLLLPVLAVSLLLCGLFIGAAKTPEEEDPYKLTEWQESRLSDLIVYVRDSAADEYTKDGTIEQLIKLVELENNGVTGSTIGPFVQDAITKIRAVYAAANGFYPSGEDETEEIKAQKQNNSKVGEYVVEELYATFGIEKAPGEGDPPGGNMTHDPNGGEEGPGPVIGEKPGSSERFFDPELGYVSYDEVASKYHGIIDSAMDDDLVSSDEWYDIVMLYFQMLEGVR